MKQLTDNLNNLARIGKTDAVNTFKNITDMKTQLDLAKLTKSRNEQILVCDATNFSELKEYGAE